MGIRFEATGNLTSDPTVNFTKSDGTVAAHVTLASDERYTDFATGERKSTEPTFIRVTAFGAQGEYLATLGKGRLVHIEGRRVAAKLFTKSDGTPGVSLEVVASQVDDRDPKRSTPQFNPHTGYYGDENPGTETE